MFESERIYLRPLEREDLPLRVKWVNDPEVRQTLSFDYPISLAKTEQWFSNVVVDDSRRHFAVVWKETGQVIGMAGLIKIDRRHARAEIYVTIGEKEFWGKHIVDDIFAIVFHYGFVELNLHRIYGTIMGMNARSRKTSERNGLVPEGVLRQHAYCVGGWQDLHCYGILREDWERIRGRLAVKFED